MQQKQHNMNKMKIAWEDFVTSGFLNLADVAPDVGESWLRCSDAHVDPYMDFKRPIEDWASLEKRLAARQDLIAMVSPFMENLYAFVKGSGFTVILSDETGCILVTLEDNELCHEAAENIKLVPGSSWLETEVGTNGIGTCLVLQRPVQVSGEEHYCQRIHDWTCSAAPIINGEGQLVAVLQMSGPSESSHKHTLGMVAAAAKAIEELLQVQKQNYELKLVNNRINNIFRTMSDGVIIVDQRGLIEQVNPAAERILCKSRSQMRGNHVEEVFRDLPGILDVLESGKPFYNVEILAETKKENIHCLISGEAIKSDQGDYIGGAVIISPINKIKRLVNRLVGAEARFVFSDIIGQGPGLQEAIRIASIAAENESNVLLEGESGTGKEIFAQSIHNRSQRRDGPFVALNCAAIPRELMGSELFGYAEGAFTGASRGGRPGKFELASGGTLFLDEIGDMTQGKQGSLLRAIQEKKIIRIGDNKVIPVDVRIICATNKNLRSQVEKGSFREDLYYRLNVITLHLPPLRSFPDDIPKLFEHFLEESCERLKVKINSYDPEIIPALKQYNWPGNVRELQNIVERMICIARNGVLTIGDLPGELFSSAMPLSMESRPQIGNSRELYSPVPSSSGLTAGGKQNRRRNSPGRSRQL